MRRLCSLLLLSVACQTSSPGPRRAAADRGVAIEPDQARTVARVAGLERSRARAGALVPYLEHADAGVRARTALALARLADPDGASALVRALADPDPGVRADAAFALGALDQELPLLFDQIQAGHKGSEAWVRQAAQTRALAERALDARLHVEQDPRVRQQVYAALGQLVIGPGLHHIYAGLDEEGLNVAHAALAYGVHAVRRGEDAHRSDELTAKLVGLGRSPLAEVRFGVVYALARHEACQARDLFAERLREDADARVRTWAARGLGACDESVAALLPALGDADWRVQVEALRALGRRRGRGEAVPPAALREAVERAATAVRDAADGLAPAAHVVSTAMPLLDDDDLAALARSLEAGRGGAAAPALLAPLRCQVAVAVAARRGELGPLARCSGQPETPVATRVREVAALAEQARRAPPARSALHPYLGDADPRVRLHAAQALGAADDAATRTLLRTRLLVDEDAAVIEVVADAIAGWPVDAGLVAELRQALARTDGARDAAVISARAALARALVQHGKVVAAADLAALRDAGPVEVRNAVRRAQGLAPAYGLAPRFGEPPGLDARGLQARLRTSRGELVLALLADEAPETAAHFVRLARTGFYSGLRFHRVVPGFVVQGGDPRGDGYGGPGYAIPDELTPRAYERGVAGMALAGRDTGGSQFFIAQSRQPHLDGRYTAFARVTAGWEVLDSLIEGDAILGVDVETTPDVPGPLGAR